MAVIKIITTLAPAKLKGDALVAQLVEHLTLNQGVQGSSPCRRTKAFQVVVERDNALVAQLVEHLTLNQGVQGSSPCRRTGFHRNFHIQGALVAQLVEHLTLNQGVQGSSPCRRTNHSVMAASPSDVVIMFVLGTYFLLYLIKYQAHIRKRWTTIKIKMLSP